MESYLRLQETLETILGSENVYFQPPESYKIKYPCIIYERANIKTIKADNIGYIKKPRYTVKYIHYDPDELNVIEALLDLPYCEHDQQYCSENLYHDVFSLYF